MDYADKRKELLDEIIRTLKGDERLAAAWLTGSYAHNEADAVSDLDLTVVVREPFSERLCKRQKMVSGSTVPERMNLFSQFGLAAVIHENHHNAPPEGTFTFVFYAGSALMVDWVLLPLASAQRPEISLLLFDHVDIPLQPPSVPESLEVRLQKISEMTAFFWMMTAVTIKYIHRGDSVFVQTWMENLTGLVNEIERLVEGRAPVYQRGSWTKPIIAQDEQIKAIRGLIGRMQRLLPQVKQIGGQILPSPAKEIEHLLSLIN